MSIKSKESIETMTSISEKQKEKELEYLKYIDIHRTNVTQAWNDMKSDTYNLNIIKKYCRDEIDFYITIHNIEINIPNHDMSKYGVYEFDAYRKYFYPVDDKEKENAKEEFDLAWEHHKNWNMHHWDWWYENKCMNSMPISYVVEMVCDWIGMCLASNTGTALDWYLKNEHNIHLGKKQLSCALELLQRNNG